MRVVYLNPCGQLGGAETSLREILSSLRTAEPEWELVLVLGEDGPFAQEMRQRGIEVVVVPFPSALARLGDARRSVFVTAASLVRATASTALYRRRLARTLKSIGPDVIHTNGFKMHLLGAWSRPRSARLVWHIHDYVSSRRMMSRLLRLFQGACALAIANSRSVAADVQTVLPHLKVVPVYNGIDTQRFSPAGEKLDLDAISGLPRPSGPVVRVGLVGTFARWKGHRTFLEALTQVIPDMPVRGYVVGGPIYQTENSQWSMEELKQTSDRLGLNGRVGFTGFLNDVPAVMRSLDVVVHASTEPEPFGMVIVEAMACERAVVVSRAGGACELIDDGENALSHRPGDAADLARAIRALAADENYRSQLAHSGRLTAQRLFSSNRLAGELAGLYRQGGAQEQRDGKTLLRSSASAVNK